MQNHFGQACVAGGIGDSQNKRVLSGGDVGDMQTELFRARIENAIHWRNWRPYAAIERPLGAAQGGG